MVLRGEAVDHVGPNFTVGAHQHPAAVQRPRPPIWIAVTPPYRRPLERAARWDGVFCNLRADDFQPLRPLELKEYLRTALDDPSKDVVTVAHPEHTPAEYEAVGVTWLVEMPIPEPGWIDQLRYRLGVPAR